MFRKRNVFTVVLAVCCFVIGFGLPGAFGTGSGSPFCPLPKVSAQDNPCLKQESTISAMKLALLQSTLDNINYQATITSLTNAKSNTTASNPNSGFSGVAPTAVGGLPFTDTFDNTDKGWKLSSSKQGGVSISKGQLVLSAHVPGFNGQVITAQFPNLQLANFYAETDVIIKENDNDNYNHGALGAGFYVGDSQKLDAIMAYGYGGQFGDGRWSFQLYGNTKDSNDFGKLSETPSDTPLWKVGETFKLGLESKGGTYTLYLNGQQEISVQISPFGNNAGFILYADNAGDYLVAFDNLVIRQSR